ncbi:protein-disulfide reductase DsbD family protein [Sphingomonas sp. BIUV-7]|uniref:Protein-disulfide reductase DsbD family protein n=1 Tax=Sphingomonas natans TaxID=3063330 RepID=A0ABT8Y435_9SPHN|nr:thioredoxin family protein [Sphingomonas sp. BIUV-7]MDO6413077.1 protein-disulfide reductase DsbD family protein [Sphingomonas sp. BIUV-7]
MIRTFLALLALLVAAPVAAEALGTTNHITPNLVAESAAPAPGSKATLAFAMRPAATWHGYWKNPGDAGLETRVEWTAPKGLAFGAIQYPIPQTLIIAGLMNYVYERDYAMLVTVDVPKGLAPGTKLPISAKLDWLACNPSVCVPETAVLETELIVGDGHADPAKVAQFDRWRAALPRPLASPGHFAITGKVFRIEVPLPATAQAAQPYFFPLTDKLIDYAAPQKVARDGDRLVIETVAHEGAAPAKIEGVLRLGADSGVSLEATPGTIAAVSAAGASERSGDTGLVATLIALGGAVLGGLLLNIMPCVFPILSLKALSLARSGKSEADARGEALAYTAGVIAICLALGAVLLGLRAAGQTAGWAFQLQDVRVILILLVLVSAIAFNLAGLFELPAITGGDALASKGGKAGAFWTGALAAFVATPCSGPFMGVALGAALVLPAAAALAIFAGLGLGLALPFLLLGFVPALRKKLPKPGAWMDRLRRILSVPMFLTALGLAWIAGRQAGVNGMTLALTAAFIFTLGLWWVGRRQQAMKPAAWWPLIPALLVTALIVATVRNAPAAATVATAEPGHERFDEVRLAALRAEGRPVLLYFTADWCLTCKVNEKAAIERDEVADAFAAKKVVTMVGDWTNGDPAISRFLAAHGRSGVPFYLWYPAAGAEPKELPQVLTPGMLAALPA